jgi:hypothetical protein
MFNKRIPGSEGGASPGGPEPMRVGSLPRTSCDLTGCNPPMSMGLAGGQKRVCQGSPKGFPMYDYMKMT